MAAGANLLRFAKGALRWVGPDHSAVSVQPRLSGGAGVRLNPKVLAHHEGVQRKSPGLRWGS